jgi:hypothetical protein
LYLGWGFLINALITFPVALLGVLIWPGTPSKPNRLVLSEKDVALATKRMKQVQADTEEKLNETRVQLLKRIVLGWKFWVIIIWVFMGDNLSSLQYSGILIRLKSLHRYSVPYINQLGVIPPALGIFLTLVINFSTDLVLVPQGAIIFAMSWNTINMIILAIWNVPESAKWLAFITIYAQYSAAVCWYGWMNHILRHNATERSIILVLSCTIGKSSTAGVSLGVFPTTETPRFLKGWTFAAVMSFLYALLFRGTAPGQEG